MNDSPAYGLWILVILNSAIFIIFAISFTKPKTSRDWRSFGAFSGFIVALFTEMYGFPLTLYLLSGWLGSRSPQLDIFSHNAGHLWHTLFGLKGDPHFDAFHILSNVLIFGGFILLASAWEKVYRAQRENKLAATGAYAYVRHPQYIAFILIMFGFLLQWATILTMLMFPVLVWMYVHLAKNEEREAREQFGQEYEIYAARVPAFFPRLRKISQEQKLHQEEIPL